MIYIVKITGYDDTGGGVISDLASFPSLKQAKTYFKDRVEFYDEEEGYIEEGDGHWSWHFNDAFIDINIYKSKTPKKKNEVIDLINSL